MQVVWAVSYAMIGEGFRESRGWSQHEEVGYGMR